MTTVYLVSNNCFLNNLIVYKDSINFDDKRKRRPLTVNGEKIALTITKNEKLQQAESIYSSSFYTSMNTAKYLAEKNNIDIVVDERLDDRKVGIISDSSINLRNLQEHDFNYCLEDGESINDVKTRMIEVLKEIITNNEDSTIAIFTHNITITSLLTVWCNKGYNYEEKLMLNYDDEVIMDGIYTDYNIVELKFEENNIVTIKRIYNE